MSLNSRRQHISQLLQFAMGSAGRTIDELEGGSKRSAPEDPLQQRYRNQSVWHKRGDLILYVADKMRLSRKYWGPERTSPDFYNIVDQEIAKLRKKEIIAEWNRPKKMGILRLASVDAVIKQQPAMILSDAASRPVLGQEPNQNDLKTTFVSILTRGRKDNTYKFALARALLEYCRDTPYSSNGALKIPYEYLAEKFLEYYWNQECRFKIRQDFKTKSTPKVIQAIRKVFSDATPEDFRRVSEDKKTLARQLILKTVFGSARSKTSLVVPRFQKVSTGKYAEEARVFYEYDDDENTLTLKPEAFAFFRDNSIVLSMTVLAEWAKFLERINGSLPRLVAKIENRGNERGGLARYRKAYMEHTNHCFYCSDKLEQDRIHVDHFIPWSYIFEDEPWNLVLACTGCNLKKSDSLAQEEFRSDLIRRNQRYRSRIRLLDHSLQIIDTKRGWKTEIENHYRVCQEYGFSTISMP